MRAYPTDKEMPNRNTRKHLRKEIFAENQDEVNRKHRAIKAALKLKEKEDESSNSKSNSRIKHRLKRNCSR